MSYEIAIVSGAGFCRLRKLIEMIAMPHLGISGPVTSNAQTYYRKVDIFEGTADECRAMRDALAPNPELTRPASDAVPATGGDGLGSGGSLGADVKPKRKP